MDDNKTSQNGMTLESLETASFAANVSVVVLTGLLAIAGACAWYFSTKLGSMKDEALKRFQLESAGVIASADARSAEANERTKTLEVEAEKQRERAARAEQDLLALRQRVAPRNIKGEAFLKLLEGKPKMPVEIWYLRDDPEVFNLAMEIRDFLRMAKWEAPEPIPIPPTDVARFANLPSTMGAGGQPGGVTIVIRATTQDEFRLFGDRKVNTPLSALHDALLNSLGSISISINNEAAPASGVLRVIVGPKR